jgi:type IV secretory pathway VirB3-like protein
MRDVTNFRGFYLTGLMVAGLSVLHLYKRRVGYVWLIIPIVVALPFFQYLGSQRTKANEELAEQEVVEEVFKDEGLLRSYWTFYAARGGDMNIFDTFVAASQAKVKTRPYLMAWLYVPFHLVPRALWEGKPVKGILQDMSFTRGAPMSPGIAGFFLLDGGKVWMLGCMMLLGYLVSFLDYFVITTRRGYVRAVLMGVVVANGMFLTRVFLWQYFYQVLYVVMPLLVFAWVFRTRNEKSRTARRRLSQQALADRVRQGRALASGV